jgi:hypothetical protein
MYKPFTYNQAKKKYQAYLDSKPNDNQARVSDFLLYKNIGRPYEIMICFNKNRPLLELEEYANDILLLSGTWNSWIVNTMTCQPYNIDEETWYKLHKLRYLFGPERNISPVWNKGKSLSEYFTNDKIRERIQERGL